MANSQWLSAHSLITRSAGVLGMLLFKSTNYGLASHADFVQPQQFLRISDSVQWWQFTDSGHRTVVLTIKSLKSGLQSVKLYLMLRANLKFYCFPKQIIQQIASRTAILTYKRLFGYVFSNGPIQRENLFCSQTNSISKE